MANSKKFFLSLFSIMLTLTIFSGNLIVNAQEISPEKLVSEEILPINDYYLSQGGEVISDEIMYVRINESNINEAPEVITKHDFMNEVPGESSFESNNEINNTPVTFGYFPGEGIYVPDKWNWITLRLSCIKLPYEIHGNKYQFSASYTWKHRPYVIADKDVFALVSDSNIVLDDYTFSGQAINPIPESPYNLTDYDINSPDSISESSCVGYRNKLLSGDNTTMTPRGSISVLGNASSRYGKIGVTYGHCQLGFSADISVDQTGPSLSITPSYAFDTVSAMAAINFY